MTLAERLPTLYALSEEFSTLLGLLEDPDADAADVDAELRRVAGDIQRKAGGVAAVIRQLEGLAELQKSEAKRLTDRARASQAHADRLRDYAKACMQSIGIDRLEAGTFTLVVRLNPQSVVIVDAAAIPNEYQRTRVIIEPDKTAILAAYKGTGEIVPGTEIARTDRLDIR